MFRSRFNEAFPRNAPHVGPQDIELGVAEGTPSPDVEGLLCALLGLVLNRKKPVESVNLLPPSRIVAPWSRSYHVAEQGITADKHGVQQERSLRPSSRGSNPDTEIPVASQMGVLESPQRESFLQHHDTHGARKSQHAMVLTPADPPTRSPSCTRSVSGV